MTDHPTPTALPEPVNQSDLRHLIFNPSFFILAMSVSLNVLLAEALVFVGETTPGRFVGMMGPFYVWSSVAASLVLAMLAGVALAISIHRWSKRSYPVLGRTLLGAVLTLLSVGCPACGQSILPWLGISQGLASFPLQGLDIKLLAGLLLASSILSAFSRPRESPSGVSTPTQERDGRGRQSRRGQLGTVALPVAVIVALFALPSVPSRFKLDFSAPGVNSTEGAGSDEFALPRAALLEEINPTAGFVLPGRYGDLGPQLLAAGAIDFDRFAQLYQQAGAPLTEAQLEVLTNGTDRPIVMDRENSYFLLNFFWALGLTNQNRVLEEGPMQKYGQGEIGRFASVGGWTLGKRPAAELYSSAAIVKLTPEQQSRLEEVAAGVYRPCCNNPTAFPDCNHGMAMLGLLEWLASQGATRDQMFEAARNANAFWFPQQTLEVAVLFRAVQGVGFAEAPAEQVVGPELFSAAGFARVHAWLAGQGLLDQGPSTGPQCGV